jgi:hypothetical protein
MCIQWLREIVPPPSHNTVGICNLITLLIVCYISSRLVNILEVTGAPINVSDVYFILLLVSRSSILGFRYSFFVPEMSVSFMSYSAWFIYTNLAANPLSTAF